MTLSLIWLALVTITGPRNAASISQRTIGANLSSQRGVASAEGLTEGCA